jgi:secreted trypsin-like serine protease
MRKLLVVAAALTMLVMQALSASAITFGEPDNGRHPNVGALMWEWDPGHAGFDQWCTGTLISSDVVLTAAHCTVDIETAGAEAFVSFSDQLTGKVKLVSVAEIHSHPDYGHDNSDLFDIAVLILSKPQTLAAAELPTAGQLDSMGLTNSSKFTAVGYGVTERQKGKGGGSFADPFQRMMSVSSFNTLTQSWLKLSQNPSHDDGGTCFGDSGGPNFIGSGASETNVIAGITVTGDSVCRSTNVTYRLDTASARDFLDDFVTLP